MYEVLYKISINEIDAFVINKLIYYQNYQDLQKIMFNLQENKMLTIFTKDSNLKRHLNKNNLKIET